MVITLNCERKNITGSFDNTQSPVARIADGDSVICNVLDGDWHLEKPPVSKTGAGSFFEGKDPRKDAGHCLIGPIYVEGAKPGDTLAVRINECRTADWGWSRVGFADKNHMDRLNISEMPEYFLNWDIDWDKRIAVSDQGHVVAIHPFLGVVGLAPEEPGIHTTHPPRNVGGNLDCKLVTVGSTIYLPVMCEGAYFYVGDGHAVQGDGELGGTAIECTLDKVDLTFRIVHEKIHNPILRTQNAWVTFGFDTDLTNAAYEALTEMANLIAKLYEMTFQEALAMASLVVDEHVTQIVNGVRGVHAILPDGAINKKG